MNREFMSETVHIFFCQTNVASGCVIIISKTIHMSLFFLRAGSKSVNYILYYTLIYRKIRTLHIEVHLGFLSQEGKSGLYIPKTHVSFLSYMG